jgi:hypothetical protein
MIAKYHIKVGVLICLLFAEGQAWSHDTLPLGADLQQAIDNAGCGTLYLGVGEYVHTGIRITRPVTIIGAGWMWDGTVLRNVGNGPNVTIDNPDMTGAKLQNVMLTGNGDGVLMQSEGNNLIERVYFLDVAGSGVRFSTDHHSTMLSIIGCRFQRCGQAAIYGRTKPTAQVNAINIRGNHIIQNLSDGISVTANGLWVTENIIQGNAGFGLAVPATAKYCDMMTLQKENYFESNKGGNIVRATE